MEDLRGSIDAADDPILVRACRGEATPYTPIWIMRQAGRYMQAYRDLRQRHGILDIIRTPELAAEVTLQPMQAFDLDAAIIFADILPLLDSLGLELEFVKGEGPVLHNPIRSAGDVSRLSGPPVEASMAPTLEALALVRRELDPRVALIGFSGAPFTLATYAIEGGSSRHHSRTKAFMWSEPEAWRSLMTLLAEHAGAYLAAQARAGAQVLQLFDSWAGILGPRDYRDGVLPYTRIALQAAARTGVPVIHFSTMTGAYLEDVASAGGDVVSVDWRVGLDQAWQALGPSQGIQGNLDPIGLMAPWDALRDMADQVLSEAGGRPGHIFNLGHGVLPSTPVDNVARLVDHVHARTAS